MKKLLSVACFTALLASSVVNAAEPMIFDTKIVFTGNVVDTPCTISFNNNKPINLGVLRNAAKEEGSVVQPVTAVFSNCTENGDTGLLYTKFDLALKSTTGKTGQSPTNVPYAYIQFSEDADFATPFDKVTDQSITEDIEQTLAYARLEADELNAPQPGAINYPVVFTLTFK